jgi:hypothetical protein
MIQVEQKYIQYSYIQLVASCSHFIDPSDLIKSKTYKTIPEPRQALTRSNKVRFKSTLIFNWICVGSFKPFRIIRRPMPFWILLKMEPCTFASLDGFLQIRLCNRDGEVSTFMCCCRRWKNSNAGNTKTFFLQLLIPPLFVQLISDSL